MRSFTRTAYSVLRNHPMVVIGTTSAVIAINYQQQTSHQQAFCAAGSADAAAMITCPITGHKKAVQHDVTLAIPPVVEEKPKTLSPKTIEIVKSCVPILEQGGETLIKHFYSLLLQNPEVAAFFNKTHQKTGEQPRSLARAVLGYAKNIDQLENIGPIAAQIINKHVSLNVKAEHYPIVGSCLLQAIAEVLGPETATKEVLAAWAEAYFFLADILIKAEEAAYQANAMKPGGWRNEREFVLTRKVSESPNGEISSFYFSPKDNKPIMSYEEGQYIGCLLNEKGQVYRRNYSLSSSPHAEYYRVTVKHEPEGFFSSKLHNMSVGDSIFFFPPAGEFVYHPVTPVAGKEKPLVFIAGGIGVTPLVPIMEKALKESKRPITFIHSCHNKEWQALESTVRSLAKQYPDRITIHNYYKDNEKKRMDRETLATLLPTNTDSSSSIASSIAGWFSGGEKKESMQQDVDRVRDMDVYFVGPRSFMKDMKRHLHDLKVPDKQVYYEFFGPASDI